MRIETVTNTGSKVASLPPAAPKQDATLPDPKETVTFDSKTNTYDYNGPGFHRAVHKCNPLVEGLKAAATIGIPSAIGAAEGPGLLALLGPAAGAGLGAAVGGVMGYKGSNNNPFFGGLAAAAGAGVGLFAWPILKAPGTFGGTAGAVAATATLGLGAAIFFAVQNHKADKEAIAHGYKPN